MPCRLAELNKVDCVKESTGDIRRISLIRDRLGDRVGVFCGWEDISWESFVAGANGWVCVCANFAPRMAVDLYKQTAVNKAYQAGWDICQKPLPSLRFLESGKLIQTTKSFQSVRDIKDGFSRSPLISEEVKKVLTIVEITQIN